MRKDTIAQITIRDLPKMTKKEVRRLASWLRVQAHTLEEFTVKDQMWLVTRKQAASLIRFLLIK